MKLARRATALLLVFFLVLGIMPSTVLAAEAGSNGTALQTMPQIAENPDPELPPFADVEPDAYYADAVIWAANHGITNGTSALTFSPEENCTRAQAVTMLWRAAGCPEPSGVGRPFADVSISQYYAKAVWWALEQGITNGSGNGFFSPDEICSRSQIVTSLWRAAGAPKVTGNIPFTDVKGGQYYEMAVRWAVKNGITLGTTQTTFGPEENCTRGQIVTFLYRSIM